MFRHGPFFLSFQRNTGLANITSASESAIFSETRNPLRRNGFAVASFLAVMDKNHRNLLIPVIFFHNSQLFWTLNFRRFFKTHTLTHTGKGPESTGQGQTGSFLSGPVFYRICWLMTPPMVSAASCLICAVAWV